VKTLSLSAGAPCRLQTFRLLIQQVDDVVSDGDPTTSQLSETTWTHPQDNALRRDDKHRIATAHSANNKNYAPPDKAHNARRQRIDRMSTHAHRLVYASAVAPSAGESVVRRLAPCSTHYGELHRDLVEGEVTTVQWQLACFSARD
jgi:hypothetical protein